MDETERKILREKLRNKVTYVEDLIENINDNELKRLAEEYEEWDIQNQQNQLVKNANILNTNQI